MTPIEWIAFFILLIAVLGYGAAVTLSNGAVTQAIRRLEATYRRQKTQEAERALRGELDRHLEQLRHRLSGDGAWREVMTRLLIDAGIGDALLDDTFNVYATPVPYYSVAAAGGHCRFLFTTDPDRLRADGVIRRNDPVVPLDASLSPYARVEAQALWNYCAEQSSVTVGLPRDAAWYLVQHLEQDKRPRVRRSRWWRK